MPRKTQGVRPQDGPHAPRGGRARQTTGTVLESLRATLEEFGLNGYEARVMVALLQARSATAAQLASASGIGRTSVYPVLDSLALKGLAEALPGKLWASSGREEVLRRLLAAEEERLHRLEAHMEAAQQLLAKLPEDGATSLPYVHFISSPEQVLANYERLLGTLESDLMMFVRPPYTWTVGHVNRVVLDTMQRGVTARVIFEEERFDDPEAGAFRSELAQYIEAGVQFRVVDSLPLKLTIFDRKVVLLVMEDPVVPTIGYPTTQLIEHPGYAEVQADAFESRWARATPLGQSDRFRAHADASAGSPSPEGPLADVVVGR